jgi:hypothetical protein
MSFILTTYFYITHCMPHTDVLTRWNCVRTTVAKEIR